MINPSLENAPSVSDCLKKKSDANLSENLKSGTNVIVNFSCRSQVPDVSYQLNSVSINITSVTSDKSKYDSACEAYCPFSGKVRESPFHHRSIQ